METETSGILNIMGKSILVVDTLRFSSLFSILTKFRSARSVFYLHKTGGILNCIVLKVLGKCGWDFKPIEWTSSPIGDFSPFKELEKLLIDKIRVCRDEIFSKQIDRLVDISESERRRLSTCFAKYAVAEIYFAMQLYILLVAKFPFKDKIRAVLLRRTLFSDVIINTYQNSNLTLYFYRPLTPKKFFPRKNYYMDRLILRATSLRIVSFIKPILLIFYSLLCKLISLFSTSRRLIKEHKICALVFNDTATELSNCLPWATSEVNNLKDETLSLCLPNMPEAAKDFYRRRSDRLVEYSLNPFLGNKDIELIKTWSKFIDYFLKNIRIYRRLFGLEGIKGWMSKYLLEIITYLSFFESLFLVNGNRVLWTMNEDDSQVQIAAMAIYRVGGLSLGTTWSQVPYLAWKIQRNQNDIFFVWGKRLLDVRIDNDDQCAFFVTIGYPANKVFKDEFRKAQDLRATIVKHYKAKNILVFIDNAAANDIFVLPKVIFEIYEEAFAWLKKDTSNFLVIKSKRKEMLDKYPSLKEKIDELREKRRILILYDRSVIYPGLAADAVISASPTLPSLAAVLGRPFIFYDVHGVTREYPLALPNIHIVSKAAEIRQTLNFVIEESHRNGYPEKLQRITGSTIDPFVDGRAAERMSEYIKNLLKQFNGSFSNIEAINYANERYKRQWGEDTVIPGPLQVSS